MERYVRFERKNKVIDYLLNTENPYTLKMDNMNIEMTYSENNKTFNECMLNILNKKNKNGLTNLNEHVILYTERRKRINGRKKIKIFFY